MFGGKETETKIITNKTYEITSNAENKVTLIRRNNMFKNRSRSAIASINLNINNFDPFIVVVGGSDEYSSLNNCELYYPPYDTYYAFPSIKTKRENASICVINNLKSNEGLYIYVMGGFDKNAIKTIERIKMEFNPTFKDYPLVSS